MRPDDWRAVMTEYRRATHGLTPRQAEILRFIVGTVLTRQGVPAIREIGERFGIGSPNGVVAHLNALADKGFIELGPGRQARSWRLAGCRLVLKTDETEAGRKLKAALEDAPCQP